MIQRKVAINVNSNFHHAAKEDLFGRQNERFIEYRRQWKERPQEFSPGDFPLFIDIEVTSACNLKCPFCATTFRGSAIKKGFMPIDMIKRIIDEGSENNLYGVKFNIRGEPLLHPQIAEFVKYAKTKGLIDVYFNSNAMLLSQKVSRDLIDAGLDRISISAEGCTKEIYEKYRVGADFDIILANIKTLQALKNRLGVSHPKVRVQTVMHPDIMDTFDEYKKFWVEIADEVAYLDYKEMKARRKGVSYPWACPQIWQRMAVWWDGTIMPCNHDDDGLLALGKVGEISIKKAWNAEKLRRIREAHKMGASSDIPACDGCYLRDSEIRKILEKGKER